LSTVQRIAGLVWCAAEARVTENGHNRISRRQALRRMAAAGAAAWAVPAVQTINMSRAFAQTQMSQPGVCSWFRISQGELTTGGALGTCGQPISPSDSCLSAFGVVDCSPLLGMPLTPSGSGWTVCLAAAYRVQEVAVFDAAGRCWLSIADPADPMIGRPVQSANGTGGWVGWTVGGGCLNVLQPTDAVGAPVDITHFDVIACSDPAALVGATPSGTPTPSESPSPGSPSPEGSPTPTESPTPSESPSPPDTTGGGSSGSPTPTPTT